MINKKSEILDEKLYWERIDKEELEKILKVLKGLVSKIWLLILVFCLTFITGYAVTELLFDKEYTSELNFFIKNYDGKNSDTIYENVDFVTAANRRYSKNIINLCHAVIQENEYYYSIEKALLETKSIEELEQNFEVINTNGENRISLESLKKCITYEKEVDGAIIKCKVTAKNKALTVDILKIVVDTIPMKFYKFTKIGLMSPLGDITTYENPTYPHPIMNGFKCGMTAFSILLLFLVLKYYYDDKITDNLEFENKLGDINLGFIKRNSCNSYNEENDSGYENVLFSINRTINDSADNAIIFTSETNLVACNTIVKELASFQTTIGQKVIVLEFNQENANNSIDYSKIIENASALKKVICKQQNGFDYLSIDVSNAKSLDNSVMSTIKAIVDDLKNNYEYVYIVLPDNEYIRYHLTANVSQMTSGLVMFIQENVSTYKNVEEMIRRLKLNYAKFSGIVMLK